MGNNNTYFEYKRTTYGKVNYLDKVAAENPGWKVRHGEELLKKYNDLKKDVEIRRQKYETLKNAGDKTWVSASELYRETYDKFKEVEKALLTGSVFMDQKIDDRPYIPSESDFSIGDLVIRQIIDPNRVRVPMDHYHITDTAQEVKEGETSELVSLTDSLTMISTESTDSIIFDDIQATTGNVYDDDKEIIEAAFDSIHDKRFINAENKKALEILIGSKDATAVSAENVQKVINTYLCGKAKRNTIIITNKSGFAKLDIDINGISLITKVTADKMVYKGKYEVIEMPDEILPDTENGSPIIIGDIAHILKFYLIRKDSLFKNDIFPYIVADRQIKKEIITLTTKSDEAYIVGYLA